MVLWMVDWMGYSLVLPRADAMGNWMATARVVQKESKMVVMMVELTDASMVVTME